MKDFSSRTLHEVEGLEERLQAMKWTMSVRIPSVSIVSKTAGLLGRRFPPGVTYEQRVRQTWQTRVRHAAR
jgi:hypothetical protein